MSPLGIVAALFAAARRRSAWHLARLRNWLLPPLGITVLVAILLLLFADRVELRLIGLVALIAAFAYAFGYESGYHDGRMGHHH